MHQNLTITGYRAIRDQEEMIEEHFQKKIKSLRKLYDLMLRVLPFIIIGIVLSIRYSRQQANDSLVSYGIRALMNVLPVVGMFAMGVLVFTLLAQLKESFSCEKKIRNLWGGKKKPTTLYSYRENVDEFEVFLQFAGSEEHNLIGRVDSSDEIAKNFDKDHAKKDRTN